MLFIKTQMVFKEQSFKTIIKVIGSCRYWQVLLGLKRPQGYFPPGQRKYDLVAEGGSNLSLFIKVQYFHWDKKKKEHGEIFLFAASYVLGICFSRKVLYIWQMFTQRFLQVKFCTECKGNAIKWGPSFSEVQSSGKGQMCGNLKYRVLSD